MKLQRVRWVGKRASNEVLYKLSSSLGFSVTSSEHVQSLSGFSILRGGDTKFSLFVWLCCFKDLVNQHTLRSLENWGGFVQIQGPITAI